MSGQPGLFDPPPAVAAEEGRRRGRQQAAYGTKRVARNDTLWVERARRVARDIAAQRGRVTSDDLHEVCPLPEGAHHNLMGAVWRGIGLPVLGYETSRRPEAHSRVIRVYGPPP